MEAPSGVISLFTGALTTQSRSGQSLERLPTSDNRQAIRVKSAIMDRAKIRPPRKDRGAIALSTAEEALPSGDGETTGATHTGGTRSQGPFRPQKDTLATVKATFAQTVQSKSRGQGDGRVAPSVVTWGHQSGAWPDDTANRTLHLCFFREESDNAAASDPRRACCDIWPRNSAPLSGRPT